LTHSIDEAGAALPELAAGGDHQPRAILAICSAAFVTNLQDTVIKAFSGSYPFHEMQTLRGFTALCIVIAVLIWREGGVVQLPAAILASVIARGLALSLASALYYLCAAAMPLPAAVALYFTMPIIIALLAGPVLGERVEGIRWLAVGVGFAGILVMLRPDAGVFEPAALFGLAAAGLYATGNLMTRSLASKISPLQLIFWQSLMYLVVPVALSAVFGRGTLEINSHVSLRYLTRGWVMPSERDLALFLVVGLGTAVLYWLYTAAYRLAQSSFVAPFEYSAMFWAAIFSFIAFGQIPGSGMIAGSALIAAGGLLLIWMDRRRNG
jgi:drug/metabolite transporter (DMT)-like permease